jgi:hypothetical protein
MRRPLLMPLRHVRAACGRRDAATHVRTITAPCANLKLVASYHPVFCGEGKRTVDFEANSNFFEGNRDTPPIPEGETWAEEAGGVSLSRSD